MQALRVAARQLLTCRVRGSTVEFYWAGWHVASSQHPKGAALRYDAEKRQIHAKQVDWWVLWARLEQRYDAASWVCEHRPGPPSFLAFDNVPNAGCNQLALNAAGRCAAALALDALRRLDPQPALLEAARHFDRAWQLHPLLRVQSALWRRKPGARAAYYALYWCGVLALYWKLPPAGLSISWNGTVKTLHSQHSPASFGTVGRVLARKGGTELIVSTRACGSYIDRDGALRLPDGPRRLLLRKLAADLDRHYANDVASRMFSNL